MEAAIRMVATARKERRATNSRMVAVILVVGAEIILVARYNASIVEW